VAFQSGPEAAEVVERASTIESAIESMSAGLAIYDRDDRLVECNEAYRRMYPEVRHLLRPGVSHEEILRAYYPGAPVTLVEGRSVEHTSASGCDGGSSISLQPTASFLAGSG